MRSENVLSHQRRDLPNVQNESCVFPTLLVIYVRFSLYVLFHYIPCVSLKIAQMKP